MRYAVLTGGALKVDARRKKTLVWTIVTTCIGVMVSLQYHDVLLGGAAIWSAQPDIASVASRLQAVTAVNAQLRDETAQVLRETLSLQRIALRRGGAAAQLERQMHAAIVLTGFAPLMGPGVVVTIDDGGMSAVDQEQFLTHDWDLRSVVNELFLAGADAVAVNGARVTAQTGIFCIGPVVRVGSIRLGPPFVIRAIGDPGTLAAALAMPGGVLDALRAANRGLRISGPETAADVHVPAYSAPLSTLKGGALQ